MKYVITWEARPNLTEEAAKRSLLVFSKWAPAHPEHFHSFLGRIDGNGGFAVTETDDPSEVLKDLAPLPGSNSASTRAWTSPTRPRSTVRRWRSSTR